MMATNNMKGKLAVEIEYCKPRYRADIDGLRAIAVMSVVFYHASVPLVRSGFIGVDIFFVISGYLIAGIVFREVSNKQFRFIEFYARRARRILPALFVTVVLVCVAGWFLLGAADYSAIGESSRSSLLAISNFSFWQHEDYFDRDSSRWPLLMTWSLGVEEQFYVVFPAIVLLISSLYPSRIKKILIYITCISFVYSLCLVKYYPMAAFYLLPSRAWEISMGALLAAWDIERAPNQRHQHRLLTEVTGIFGLTLVIASATCIPLDAPFPGLLALPPVVGAITLVWAEESFVNRYLLSARPMVFIGLVSYSWYLWHWPLLAYLHIVSVNPPRIRLSVTVGLIALALAIGSWRFVERPFRRSHLPPAQLLCRYAVILALLCGITQTIKSMGGFEARLSGPARVVEATIRKGRGDCLAASGVRTPDLSGDCVVERGGSHGIALLGDSHAAAIGPGLRDLAGAQGWDIAILAKSGCEPLLGATVNSPTHPSFASDCKSFVENELGFVVKSNMFDVVVLAGMWSNWWNLDPELYRAALTRSVRTLQAAGKQVVLVQDVPGWRLDPVAEAWASAIPLRGALARALWLDQNEPYPADGNSTAVVQREPWLTTTIEQVAAETNSDLVDLTERFCHGTICRFKSDKELLYIDDTHLSVYGSAIAASQIFQEARSISDKVSTERGRLGDGQISHEVGGKLE